jgi:hypothetical protein
MLYQIAWQHDRQMTRAAILWLQQFNRSDMSIEYTPAGSTTLNLIFCPNLDNPYREVPPVGMGVALARWVLVNFDQTQIGELS